MRYVRRRLRPFGPASTCRDVLAGLAVAQGHRTSRASRDRCRMSKPTSAASRLTFAVKAKLGSEVSQISGEVRVLGTVVQPGQTTPSAGGGEPADSERMRAAIRDWAPAARAPRVIVDVSVSISLRALVRIWRRRFPSPEQQRDPQLADAPLECGAACRGLVREGFTSTVNESSAAPQPWNGKPRSKSGATRSDADIVSEAEPPALGHHGHDPLGPRPTNGPVPPAASRCVLSTAVCKAARGCRSGRSRAVGHYASNPDSTSASAEVPLHTSHGGLVVQAGTCPRLFDGDRKCVSVDER